MHWTYDPLVDGDLEQGDILTPDDRLRGVLDEVHRHFNGDKYLAFMVTTQSCDLVRRRGYAGARYISIATVRSLKSVWLKLLSAVAQAPLGGSYFNVKDKQRAELLFKRIIDQNEQALGLFYLHPDVDASIGEPAVAFLRVTISLRAEHYDALVAARSARLRSDFRAKFGWLLGNLYARAATRDWGDEATDRDACEDLRQRLIEGRDAAFAPHWHASFTQCSPVSQHTSPHRGPTAQPSVGTHDAGPASAKHATNVHSMPSCVQLQLLQPSPAGNTSPRS